MPTSTKEIGTYLNNRVPIYLECLADSVPESTYNWNSPVGEPVGKSSKLEIRKPTKDSQFGVYVCEARNNIGFARHKVKVIKIGMFSLDMFCMIFFCYQIKYYVHRVFTREKCKNKELLTL